MSQPPPPGEPAQPWESPYGPPSDVYQRVREQDERDVEEAREGYEFHRLLRGSRRHPLLGLLGIAALLLGFFLIQLVVIGVGQVIITVQVGVDESLRQLDALAGNGVLKPGIFLVLLLALGLSTFAAWFSIFVVSGLKPRWLSSVLGGIRWKWLALSFLPAIGALVAAIVLGALLPATETSDAAPTGQLNDFTATSRDFLLIILLLVPFQAAAEEYVFRGYLTQAVGSLFRAPAWVTRGLAVVVPALIFAAFHGLGQSLPIFFDRFAFGVAAGILVIFTGGLEAGIAYHVLNNYLAFLLALFFGDIGSALNPTGGHWLDVVVSFVKTVVFVALAVALARKVGVATRTAATRPGELVAPKAPV